MLGAQAVAGGLAECVIVVGFEQMEAGALQAKWNDRANPLDKFVNVMNEEQGFTQAPPAAQMFGGAGRGTAGSTARRRRSARSRKSAAARRRIRHALFKETYSLEQIMQSPEVVFDPLTRYQCCPPTCGAAAAVLCSGEFATKALAMQAPSTSRAR